MEKVYLMDIKGDRGYLYYYKMDEVNSSKIKVYDQLCGGSFKMEADQLLDDMIVITEGEYNMIVAMYDLFNETCIESMANNIHDTIEVIIHKYLG